MENHELLNAIAGLMDEKLTPINKRLDTVEENITTINGRLDTIECRLDNIEGRLDNIETNMVTKEDLRAAENMILGELDTVQEKTNQKFENLRFEVV